MTSGVLQLQGVDESRVPFNSVVVLKGTDNTPGQNPFGLVIQNPVRQSVANVVCKPNPLTGAFAAAWPTLFMIQIKNLLEKHKLEKD